MALFLGVVSNVITAILATLYARAKRRRTIVPVQIKARKIEGAELQRTKPEVLIATFSGYRCPQGMAESQFLESMKNASLEKLPLDENTLGIGHTVRLLKTYTSLKEVYLIGTESSVAAVPLLIRYLSTTLGRVDCKVVAEKEYTVSSTDDTQMVEETFRITRSIFDMLRNQKRYEPTKSHILVDVTGGVRGMSVGALLACVRSDQDIHLIGSKYQRSGAIEKSFPMVIHFEVLL